MRVVDCKEFNRRVKPPNIMSLDQVQKELSTQISHEIQKVLTRLGQFEEAQKEKNKEFEAAIQGATGKKRLDEVSEVGPFKKFQETDPPTDSNKKPEGLSGINSANLKWEYEVLKDSVSKILIPPEYRLNDSRAGIHSKDREQAAVLSRSGKFIETSLKLVGEIQRTWPKTEECAGHLDNLVLALTAHMRYLQEEYSSLQVGGQYGNHTKAIFKSLQKNTSNLNPEGIENLKTAVSISQPQNTNQFQQRGRGFYPRSFRGRGRGFQYSRGYAPRGVPQNRDYQPFQNNEITEA